MAIEDGAYTDETQDGAMTEYPEDGAITDDDIWTPIGVTTAVWTKL